MKIAAAVVGAALFLLLVLPAALLEMAVSAPLELPDTVREVVSGWLPDAQDAPPSLAKWICPLPLGSFSITSEYGWRVHPITGIPTFHHGIDMGAPQGTPVYAARAGTVTTAAYNSSAGNHIIIDHGDGFDSRYLHLAAILVSYGGQVRKGQVIGYVGSTGESTGPHLDFRIHYNGASADPTAYVRLTGEPLPERKPDPPKPTGPEENELTEE